MAKKRDRHWTGNDRRRAEGPYEKGDSDPQATDQGGMSFAETDTAYGNEGDLGAWEDDQKTAPDLFADASDEDRMLASGGHTQQPDEELKASDALASRFRRR
jgi:hypothetical protein